MSILVVLRSVCLARIKTIFLTGAAIVNAQQCLLGKEAVWLRERPMFEGSNEPRIEILNCHQSLLHGKEIHLFHIRYIKTIF